LAVANAPVDLIFSNNATDSHDEGSFFVNWTSGVGDAEANYSIYVFSNDTLYLKANNDSALGYSFSNTTEANYTFIIEAVNVTATGTNSTTNVSIYVDSTIPTIILPEYANATLIRNNQNLTLNVLVSDGLSGLIGSVCLINVNGTNQSVSVSSGWCNSSIINLTDLSDGNQTINVYVNDSVNNFGLNSSYVAQIDTTSPILSDLTLSSSSKTSLTITFSGGEGTCTASGTGTTSVSDSTLTVTSLSCGISYSYIITCTDLAGNAGNFSSTSFSTMSCGSSSTTPSFWTNTQIINDDQFINGFTKELAVKNRLKMSIDNEDHYLGIIELTDTTAKINVSSNPQQEVFNIGDSKKFEVTGDNFYDILVTLNSIDSNKANVTIISISEEMEELTGSIGGENNDDLGGENESGDGGDNQSDEKNKNLIWLWIVLGLIVLGGVGYFFRNKIRDLFG